MAVDPDPPPVTLVTGTHSGSEVADPGFGLVTVTHTLVLAWAGVAVPVAVNCIQLELSVWTEGYTATLGEGNYEGFEDPVIMTDAVLWLSEQPLDYTGHVLTIAKMREMGVVRPETKVGQV